jgi:hypothetical protein
MEQIKVPKTGKGDPDKFIGDVYVDMITGPDAAWTPLASATGTPPYRTNS